MSAIASALKEINLKITSYNPNKLRSVGTSRTPKMSIEKLGAFIRESLGPNISDHPEVVKATFNVQQFEEMIVAHVEKTLERPGDSTSPGLSHLTLNYDMSHKGSRIGDAFFLTDEKERISEISGSAYLMLNGLSGQDAMASARLVVPRYLPHGPVGVSQFKLPNTEPLTIYNRYVRPKWHDYEGWDKLPDKLPALFEKLVNHLFPILVEREFFYSWLWHSMFDRASTYLILCGKPGTGKNRMKIVMRALHGHENSADGKKSSLDERFNSQLQDTTLLWFDELRYNERMENVMKELQNSTLSIEAKGVDATKQTRIYASSVISNNKPRDNYLAPDARKFVPLVITHDNLNRSMTQDEIQELTDKVDDPFSKTFDVAFVAQIAKWVKKNGKSKKWPNLEYRGPMFYSLVHTSLALWQKKTVEHLLRLDPTTSSRLEYDAKKGYLWSSVQAQILRKSPERNSILADYTNVQYFLDMFLDGAGKKVFKTTTLEGAVTGDFWVRVLDKDTKILTEAQVAAGILPTKGENNGTTKGKQEQKNSVRSGGGKAAGKVRRHREASADPDDFEDDL